MINQHRLPFFLKFKLTEAEERIVEKGRENILNTRRRPKSQKDLNNQRKSNGLGLKGP